MKTVGKFSAMLFVLSAIAIVCTISVSAIITRAEYNHLLELHNTINLEATTNLDQAWTTVTTTVGLTENYREEFNSNMLLSSTMGAITDVDGLQFMIEWFITKNPDFERTETFYTTFGTNWASFTTSVRYLNSARSSMHGLMAEFPGRYVLPNSLPTTPFAIITPPVNNYTTNK